MKRHFGILNRGNESDPWDTWSPTACGLETESPMTERWDEVTCKNCLKIKNRKLRRFSKKTLEQIAKND